MPSTSAELAAARPTVTTTADALPSPDEAWRDAALDGPATPERHDALASESGCFAAARLLQPDMPASAPTVLKVSAWNLERAKQVENSAAVLRDNGADICLLSELDAGMVRSGNRDTPADLAAALGMGHAFAVEFIELGLGDVREQAAHASEANRAALHGNAVLSRFAIDRVSILPLDPGGAWFTSERGNTQRRIGGRNAVAVRHLVPDPLWVVAVHYESRLGPADRAEETRVLLDQITDVCGDEPVLIGGDVNCKGLAEAGLTGDSLLVQPGSAEPMFARLAEAGFDWLACNTAEPTTRLHPWHDTSTPIKKIDWFFARGLTCRNPSVVPATGVDGANLSDHELLLVEVCL